MLDVTITSTVRPEILEKTLTSFKNNLFNDTEINIIINIDNVGDLHKHSADDCLKIVSKFSKNFRYNISNKPNFARAIIWCWSNVENDYIFHLEDDWICTGKFSLDYMLKLMNNELKNYRYKYIRLHRKEKFCQFEVKTKNNVHSMRPPYDIINLSPTLFNKYLISYLVTNILNDKSDPEKQLKISNFKSDVVNNMRECIYSSSERTYVTDIGRYWRNKKKIIKKGVSWIYQ